MGTFGQRTRFLEQQVGSGKLTMGLTVHQPYAADEHEELHYKHPRGGGPKYVQDPFFSNLVNFIHILANNAVTVDGSDLRDAAQVIAREMNQFVERKAPVKTNVLRRSGSAYVLDDGQEVFRIPQRAPYNWEKE